MIISDAMPMRGQFVALWFTDEGAPFSRTLKWQGGKLLSYDVVNDAWIHEFDAEYLTELLSGQDATFFRGQS